MYYSSNLCQITRRSLQICSGSLCSLLALFLFTLWWKCDKRSLRTFQISCIKFLVANSCKFGFNVIPALLDIHRFFSLLSIHLLVRHQLSLLFSQLILATILYLTYTNFSFSWLALGFLIHSAYIGFHLVNTRFHSAAIVYFSKV